MKSLNASFIYSLCLIFLPYQPIYVLLISAVEQTDYWVNLGVKVWNTKQTSKSADCRFQYQVQRYNKCSARTSFGDLKSKLFLGLLFSSILIYRICLSSMSLNEVPVGMYCRMSLLNSNDKVHFEISQTLFTVDAGRSLVYTFTPPPFPFFGRS